MVTDPIVFTIFLIFSGAALLATAALYARQALIVSYIVLGILLGPSVLGWVSDPSLVKDISDVGIMFLLFLLGLNLHPQKLLDMLREATVVAGASSIAFAAVGGVAGWFLGLTRTESLLLGGTLMFSSTIIGLKLLPTTVLHHQRTGEIIISILLVQDLIAIVILLLLQAGAAQKSLFADVGFLLFSLLGLILLAFLLERYVLVRLIARFDGIHEYIFLLTIGWCLGVAELGAFLGLSREIGAFIAGVTIAASRIALFISESLKPLRDFFLIIFFFALGAGIDLRIVKDVFLPAAALAAVMLLGKPFVFRALLRGSGESVNRSMEIGVRLGQGSEFSLLIATLALELGVIGREVSYLIQLSTLITFIASTYMIVLHYPTPIAVSDKLRRN